MLSHEKMIVYQKSITFLSISVKVIEALPKGHSSLADQFRRASMSVPLNIAEATGKTGLADNARHFSIARGSALECGAILDVCSVLEIIQPTRFRSGKDILEEVVAMLSKLCKK